MTVAIPDNRFFEPHMTVPLTGSLIFHAIVVVLMIVGIPFISRDIPTIEDPISVELVSAEQAAKEKIETTDKTVKERPPQNDKPPPDVVPRKVMPEVKELPKPAAPTAPEKPSDLAPPVKEKAAVATPKPPTAKPKPKPPEKKPVVEEQDQQDEFKSVLKNLLPDEAVQSPDQQKATAESAEKSRFAPKMSMGELDALRHQLSQCWKLMSGARYAENLVVDIRLFVNPDRTIRAAQIVDTMRYNTDSYYRAAADSALRAVRNPQCSPLDLPPQKYELWKVMTVSFDPRDML